MLDFLLQMQFVTGYIFMQYANLLLFWQNIIALTFNSLYLHYIS